MTGHTAIQLSRGCMLVLLAFAFVVGCASPSHVQTSHPRATPTPTPQPSPGTGQGCPNSDGKAPALVTLQEYSFHPGHDVVFNGTGFQPGEGVDVRLGILKSDPNSQNNQSLTTVHGNNQGNMTGSAHIAMMTPGTYHLYFIGEQCTPPLTINIILLPFTPWVVLDTYAPHPHYLLGFRGQDFAPNESVQVYLNDQNSTPVAQVQADNSGQFAVNQVWDVGDLTGDNTLLFVGMTTKIVVSVSFTVIAPQPAFHAIVSGQLFKPAGPVTAGGLAANHSSATGGVSAQAQSNPSGILPFLNIDPMVFVLGFLIVWFILCIVLAAALSTERLPRLPRLKWPSKPAGAINMPNPTASESAAEPARWPQIAQSGLPTPGMQVSARAESGQAPMDQEKEDHFLAITGIRKAQGQFLPFALLVVADSVGHYTDGQSAGRRTIHTLFQSLASCLVEEDVPSDELSSRLENALQGVNRLLYWQNQRENASTSCSATAALISSKEAHICNIGNSRAYLLPAHASLRRVTTDHSIISRSGSTGYAQHDGMYTDFRRSRLYRSLGQHPDVRIDLFRLPIGMGDQLLLCSNGLWETLADVDLETLLRQDLEAAAAANTLIEQAKVRGNLDNITAVVMRLVEGALSSNDPGIDNISSGSSHLSRQHIF